MEEIELTYLPKELPVGLKNASSKEMIDIYIPQSSSHPTLRIRHIGDKYEMTKKTPVKEGDASHQIETTIPLTKEEFDDLEKIEGKRVSKTRYYYKENGINFEIDVFQQKLKGLVLVEVEFKSLEEKSNFVTPEWLLAEVTQSNFIAGGMLCGKQFDDISDELMTFNYEPLEIQ